MELKIGFLSVRQHAEHGYFGGYLILNHLSRPLEFHCTLPVKPSRAQSLLYGPTLNDFVCGEQIAKALVNKAKIKPGLVVTDTRPVLALQHISSEIVVLTAGEAEPESNEDGLVNPSSKLSTYSLTGQPVHLLQSSRDCESSALDLLSQLDAEFDMDEPFQRIQEALLEAHPIVRAA